VLSNDQTQRPKWSAKKILDKNNNCISFLLIDNLLFFKYWNIKNGNNINAEPCILQDARRNGGISPIDCKIVPAEETANNAIISIDHAIIVLFLSLIFNPPIRLPLFLDLVISPRLY